MDNEQIRSEVENLVDDSVLELTKRTLDKIYNLVNELKTEDITWEEIREEFALIIPSSVEEDEWSEFTESIATFVYSLVESGGSSDDE